MKRIKEILKKDGPMLSGKLATILGEKYLLSNEAARKAISRATLPVKKLRVFPFDKNQVFCYLEEQENSQLYRERLYGALKENAQAVSVILQALENMNNIVQKDMLAIYSKSPVEATKGHRTFERVMFALKEQKIVDYIDGEYYVISSMYRSADYDLTYSKSEKMIAEIVANDFVSWAAKLNLIAYNSFKIFPSEAIFAHFKWFATIPSYVSPLYDFKKKRPGFVVVDVLIKSDIVIEDVSFFVEKVNIIRNFKGLPSFTPVLLLNGASNATLEYLKENKVVVGILTNLFDKKYTETLMNIQNVLQNATAVLLNEPKKIEELIKEIAKSEGRFNNAMGSLFECMVGLLFSRMGSRYIELNKQIPDDHGKKYEMDVLVDRDGKIIVVECKAYRGKLHKEYIETWLSKRIPIFRKFLGEIYPGRKIEFSIWALGGFEISAQALLEEHRQNVRKYELSYYDKQKMYQYANQCNDKEFCRQIREYFSEYGEETSAYIRRLSH